ncbi:hypothetical protein ACFL4W_02760 [Planctomycetota bacterium]
MEEILMCLNAECLECYCGDEIGIAGCVEPDCEHYGERQGDLPLGIWERKVRIAKYEKRQREAERNASQAKLPLKRFGSIDGLNAFLDQECPEIIEKMELEAEEGRARRHHTEGNIADWTDNTCNECGCPVLPRRRFCNSCRDQRKKGADKRSQKKRKNTKPHEVSNFNSLNSDRKPRIILSPKPKIGNTPDERLTSCGEGEE